MVKPQPKIHWDAELTAAGEQKIAVIKIVKEVMARMGSKDLVDGAPKMLKTGLKKEAEALKKQIEEAGGKLP